MRRLFFIAIPILLALCGCCGARFGDPNFCSDCSPQALAADASSAGSNCPPGGLQNPGSHLRGWWQRATYMPPAAPVPPPNPKYHPVPTRPVFAPRP